MELPSDKELFEATETDVAPEIADTPAEQPAAEEGQPRDDHGRFAPKAQDEPEQQQQPAPQAGQPQQQAREEAHVPSWRVREIREEHERRLNEERANWQRQMEALQRQHQPRQEPQPATDFYADPDRAFDERFQTHLGQAIGPVQQQLQAHAQMLAGMKYGDDKVQEAETAFMDAMRNRTLDPADYQRVVSSPNRYAAAVQWHQQKTVLQTIGTDPNAWFEKELERRMADPAFAGAQLQRIQQSARDPQNPQAQGKPLVHIPPSLRNAPAARASNDDSENGDISNDALWAHANR